MYCVLLFTAGGSRSGPSGFSPEKLRHLAVRDKEKNSRRTARVS